MTAHRLPHFPFAPTLLAAALSVALATPAAASDADVLADDTAMAPVPSAADTVDGAAALDATDPVAADTPDADEAVDNAPPPGLADAFWQALGNGKVDVSARYRFEQVDDDQQPALRHAHANTLRTTLGYATGLVGDVGAYLQVEDVRVVGDARYGDGGGNGITDRATVVDPEGTEVQQAYLRYRGLPRTQVMFGRQEIEHRTAPLNRFVGAVPWRQNAQSFDGVRIVSDRVPALRLDYAYVWNVDRIFGEDNPLPDRSDYDVAGHLFDATYSYAGDVYGSVEAYAYLLNFDSNTAGTQALSTATYGARVQGTWDVLAIAGKLNGALEYALQRDYADNPIAIAVDYRAAELGFTEAFPGPVLETLNVKLNYERLEGDGRRAVGAAFVPRAFQTPLGTNHAFQGWADRFLTTPADGVEDWFATFGGRVFATHFTVTFHRYAATDANYDYGHEWNLQATRVFGEHYTLGAKYARYSASDDSLNLARNGAASTGKQAFDLVKFWFWIEARF